MENSNSNSRSNLARTLLEQQHQKQLQAPQRKRASTQQQGQQQIMRILREEEHDQKPEQNLVLGRESNIDYSKLTSFLVGEDSFFTPWRWSGNKKPEGKDDQNHSASNSRIGEQQRLHLELVFILVFTLQLLSRGA